MLGMALTFLPLLDTTYHVPEVKDTSHFSELREQQPSRRGSIYFQLPHQYEEPIIWC